MNLERSSDRCVQCGFCLPACPTYRLYDDEESSPRGRLALAKALDRGEVEPTTQTLATFAQCLGCRACESACPSGVIYEEAFLYGRETLAQISDPLPWYARTLLSTLQNRLLLGLARTGWRFAGSLGRQVGHLLPSQPPYSLLAALPAPTHKALPDQSGPTAVALHRGCLMDIFWQRTNTRAALLLRHTGRSINALPDRAGCCGALHAHQGDRTTARRLAQQLITTFEDSGADILVNLAGGCSAFIKGYPELFPVDDPWHARAVRLSRAVRDIASLLRDSAWQVPRGKESLTYQDSCHLRHGLGVWREPRELLEETGDYHELPSAAQCCGSAGIYNLLQPDTANTILAAKVRELDRLGVEVIVTSNPGCELQWRLGVQQAGLPVQVRHLVDHLYMLWQRDGFCRESLATMPVANQS